MSNPNAERYSDISTAQIVALFDQGLSHRKIGKRLSMGPCAVGNRLRAAGKVRAPIAVTKEQLKKVRLDPAWEARRENRGIVPVDRIVCRECGELKSEINANGVHSHLRTHAMKPEKYEGKYLGARLTSFARSADQNRRQGRSKTVDELMDEFAAMYVTPKERALCRLDPKWEIHNEIGDEFVICRVCGLKSKTDLHCGHLERHDLTPATYRAKFPEAPLLPDKMREQKNAKTRDRVKDLRHLGKQVKAGELVPSPLIDKEKIALAARLEIEGMKPYAMTDLLYPPRPGFEGYIAKRKTQDRKLRFDRTKKFLSRNRERIDLDKERQARRRSTPAIAV